ncbi:hypothetical protein GCM10009830_33690 [Glycomyces endophyticus]|uniref:Uncharacterized protein n=1 Tax=Glycomyces endophyticus TaxID=480996 RepID=A0ABP4T7N6_9ACTN
MNGPRRDADRDDGTRAQAAAPDRRTATDLPGDSDRPFAANRPGLPARPRDLDLSGTVDHPVAVRRPAAPDRP